MSRTKIAEKKRRKDELDPTQDQFIAKTMTVFDWMTEHRRPLIAGVCLVILGTVVYVAVSAIVEKGHAEKTDLLFDAVKVAMGSVRSASADPTETPPLPKGELSFDTRSARATQATDKFVKVEQELGGSEIGAVAALGEAASRYDLGQYDKAIAAYEKFLGEVRDNAEWLRPAAIEGLAYSYEAKGKLDEAAAKWREMEKGYGDRTALLAKYHQARIAERKNEKDRAVALLKDVVTKLGEQGRPDRFDDLFAQTRERLLALDPSAEVPDMPSDVSGLEGIDPALLQKLLRAKSAGKAP
ncbi:MAG: hypothetical protein PHU25_00135 [Deltaproteobacteria bacterium]|nr:hypothetical protein [Deltaproteobacteria bacterium]